MDINRDAAATASTEAIIHAPMDVVWSVHTDIDNWSTWNPDVSKSELHGPLEPGTAFRWKAGGLPIASTLQEVAPKHRIVWTGRTMGIRAIHVWTFTPDGSGVLVRTEESFDGMLVRLFAAPMRRMLADSLEKGLAALKAEAERRSQ